MSLSLNLLYPDAETLLALQPEDLAGVILEHLLGDEMVRREIMSRARYTHTWTVEDYPRHLQGPLLNALAEAWSWLEREGIFAPKPGDSKGWVFITRRGQQITNRVDLEAFRKANLLPEALLHPTLARSVRPLFVRGDYDTAVFQAYKEVEIAVRGASGYDATKFGLPMLRDAFNQNSGPLTDLAAPPAERDAMSQLIAGAYGAYRNPHGHREVRFDDPREAAERIVIASHLLRLVSSSAIFHERHQIQVRRSVAF